MTTASLLSLYRKAEGMFFYLDPAQRLFIFCAVNMIIVYALYFVFESKIPFYVMLAILTLIEWYYAFKWNKESPIERFEAMFAAQADPNWTCLGCSTKTPAPPPIFIRDDHKYEAPPSFKYYCCCQKQNYVCRDCYKNNSNTSHWASRFGEGHVMRDVDEPEALHRYSEIHLRNTEQFADFLETLGNKTPAANKLINDLRSASTQQPQAN